MRYIEQSYERRLFHWLNELHEFSEREKIDYAFFGGAGVAAYAGHLPRKLHDIDLICAPEDAKRFDNFLRKNGFDERHTTKARKARYQKFIFKNHIYEMIVSIFPLHFILLDLDNRDYPELAAYSFASALKRRQLLEIRSLGDDTRMKVYAIPPEDLIISKLWPTFEPNTVHDLLILLGSDSIGRLNTAYLSERVQSNHLLWAFAFESLAHFQNVYDTTVWKRLAKHRQFNSRLRTLRKYVTCGPVSPRIQPFSDSSRDARADKRGNVTAHGAFRGAH